MTPHLRLWNTKIVANEKQTKANSEWSAREMCVEVCKNSIEYLAKVLELFASRLFNWLNNQINASLKLNANN